MRTANPARAFVEAEKIFKSEIIKRFFIELDKIRDDYRGRCKLIEGPDLYRNQGKWEVLEDKVKPLLRKILSDLEKEVGNATASTKQEDL